MIIRDVKLETVCGITSVLPENQLPEFAFAGKSNVGKSSLVNALVQRKSLARTSQEPGKTATINFYNVNDAFYFVDLPGYGFAKVAKTEMVKWGRMIENYLEKSKKLKTVFLLLDFRREPSENDIMMLEYIRSANLEPILILTKKDKLSRNEQQKMLSVIRKKLKLKDEKIFPFSAVTKEGREEILNYIQEAIGYEDD